MAFQQVLRNQPAPAFEGDFATANPRDSMYAGPGELVAGPNGVTVGRFAWASPTGQVNNNGLGVGGRVGFVARHGQVVVNPTLLQRFGNLIPAGVDMTLHTMGDFWVRFAGGAMVGQKVFANFSDGTAVAGAAGMPPSAASATGTIAAGTATVTGSIAPNNNYNGDVEGGILTVTAGTGLVNGGTLSGTNVIAGTILLNQISGTPGGVGLYNVSLAQTVPSTAITEAYGTFTAASGLTGAFGVGDVLSGTGVAAGTQITALGTGTGGLGTYIVNNNTVVGSTAIAAAGAVETRWTVAKTVQPGELSVIVVHP
jgi:hypothetical protein